MKMTENDLLKSSLLTTNAKEIEEKKKKKQKQQPKEKLPWKPIVITVAVIVLAVAAFVLVGILSQKDYEEQQAEKQSAEPDESRSYYKSVEENPVITKNEIEYFIKEAYYTKDGRLAVYLRFSNGFEKDKLLTNVKLSLKASDTEEEIANGVSDFLPSNYFIPAGGYNDLLFYFEPDKIVKADADLSNMTCDAELTYDEVK